MNFIPDIETLQDFAPVAADLDIRTMKPDLDRAVIRHIRPLLGGPFLKELHEAFTGESLTEIQAELVTYINRAAAPLALWLFSKKGGVTVDNSGIYKRKNDNRWNLSESEQKNLEESYLSDGVDALDDLLNYLEENLSDFDTYENSPERTAERSSLVPSASVVLDVFHMLNPRITFHAMREGLRYVERSRLKPILQDYYTILLSSFPAEGSFAHRAAGHARLAVIYLGVARALLTRSVTLTTEGLRVMMDNKAQVSDSENARIESAARQFEKSGEEAIVDLVKLLNSSPPTGYTPPDLSLNISREKSPPNSKVAFF